MFDPDSDRKTLLKLFHRIYNALTLGGVFIFDIVEPGQVEQGTPTRGFTEGEDWVVLVEKEEEQGILTRRSITFRKVGEYYRRDEEVHCQQLCQATDLAEELRQLGFQAEIMHSYGQYPLPKAVQRSLHVNQHLFDTPDCRGARSCAPTDVPHPIEKSHT